MALLKKKTLELVVGLAAVVAFIIMTVVKQYYTFEMPTTADASSGRIISTLVNYGKVVYVTPSSEISYTVPISWLR